MRSLALIALVSILLMGADYVDRIVAIVDQEPILLSDLESAVAEEIHLRRIQGERIPVDSVSMRDLAEDVLEQIIDRKIIISRARQEEITVTRTEVDNALDEWIKGLIQEFGSEQRFLDELEKQGFTLRDFKQMYRRAVEEQILINSFIRKKFGDVRASESEVIDFFKTKNESIPDFPDAFEIARIVVLPKLGREAEERALAKVERAIDRLKSGEEFGAVASEISDDPLSRHSGGLIGKVRLEDLRKEIAEIALRLMPGEISEPIRRDYGIEIVKLDSVDAPYYKLRHIMVSLEPTHQDSMLAYQKVVDLRSRILNGEPFDKLADLESDDPETKGNGGYIGKVSMDVVPKVYRDALEKMQAGEVSEVLVTPMGFHLIKLISKESRRKPSFEEAADWIQAFLENRKREEAFANWLEQAREQIYIRRFGF
ncbi:MAG: peptidylprolyl isomerase [bacterium]